MARGREKEKSIEHSKSLYHVRGRQKDRIVDKNREIYNGLDMGIYEDYDSENKCPEHGYYNRNLPHCPACEEYGNDEKEIDIPMELSDSNDDDYEDYNKKQAEAEGQLDLLDLATGKKDIKLLIKEGLEKYFQEHNKEENFQKLCFKILEDLIPFKHILMLFSPVLVKEISRIKLKEGKSVSSDIPDGNFPVVTSELLYDCRKNIPQKSSPVFPSLDEVRGLRIISESDSELTGEISDKLEKTCKLINKLPDLLLDKAFKTFYHRIKENNLNDKLEDLSSKIKRLYLTTEDKDNIIKFLTLLLEGIDELKKSSKGGIRIKKTESLFSNIIDIEKDYDTLYNNIMNCKLGLMLFNDHTKAITENILHIFEKSTTKKYISLDAIAEMLTEQYFEAIAHQTACSKSDAEKGYNLIKKVSGKIPKDKLRKAFYNEIILAPEPGIIINKIDDTLSVKVLSIPENLSVARDLPYNIRNEKKAELASFRRKAENLFLIGDFLIKELPEIFNIESKEEIKKSIYKNNLRSKTGKGKGATFQNDIEKDTGIEKGELSKILDSETLLTPSGIILPLRIFTPTKNSFLNDYIEQIKPLITDTPLTDEEIGKKISEKFTGYLPENLMITKDDIKNFREENHITRTIPVKRKKRVL